MSQLSIESAIEEERVVLSDSDGKDTIDVPKVTSPSRSPNRKLKHKLRSLFKEKPERESKGVRSASAGRSETIEEETFEDVEAERAGVARAYSLNAKQISKPLLQSHSSTESTDVPSTPKSTPTRTKKRMSLKKSKTIEAVAAVPATELTLTGSKQVQRVEVEEGKFEAACEADDDPEVHQLSRTDFTFPETFRQAILEVDNLTEKCSQEEINECVWSEVSEVPGSGVTGACHLIVGQDIITSLKDDEESVISADKRCCDYTTESEAEEERGGRNMTLTVKKLSPGKH